MKKIYHGIEKMLLIEPAEGGLSVFARLRYAAPELHDAEQRSSMILKEATFRHLRQLRASLHSKSYVEALCCHNAKMLLLRPRSAAATQ